MRSHHNDRRPRRPAAHFDPPNDKKGRRMRFKPAFVVYVGFLATLLQSPIAAGQTISAFAGTGTGGYNGAGLAATATQFDFPSAAAFDSSGTLYILDTSNHLLRKIPPVLPLAVSNHFGVADTAGPRSTS